MKKVLFYGLLMGLSVYGNVFSSEVAQQEKDIEEYTDFLRTERPFREAAKRGAQYGAAIGGVAGIAMAVDDPKEIPISRAVYKKYEGYNEPFAKKAATATTGAVVAALGAAYGAAIAVGLRWWQINKISSVVKDHTGLNFQTLPKEQAMLIIAAYKRNVSVMQVLISRQPGFVSQEGVWQLLAELFYNKKPTRARVNDLQSMIQGS